MYVPQLNIKMVHWGVIEASTSCAPGFPRRIEISCSNGSAVLEDDKLIRWQFVDQTQDDRDILAAGLDFDGISSGAVDPIAGITSEGHRRQIVDLANAIQSRTTPSLPGREGRRAVQLICAIYDSARTGKPVKIEQSGQKKRKQAL